MAKGKHEKSGNKPDTSKVIVLVTAIISLVIKLIDLIEKLIE